MIAFEKLWVDVVILLLRLSSRTHLSGTKWIQAESPWFPHLAAERFPNTLLKNWVVLLSLASMQQRALTQLLRHWFWLSPMGFSVNQESRTFPTDPVLIFSAKENSRSFPTIDDNIELDSFTDAAIVENSRDTSRIFFAWENQNWICRECSRLLVNWENHRRKPEPVT